MDAVLDVYEHENNEEAERNAKEHEDAAKAEALKRKAKQQEGTADARSEIQADAGKSAGDAEEPEAIKAEPQEQADTPKPNAEEPSERQKLHR